MSLCTTGVSSFTFVLWSYFLIFPIWALLILGAHSLSGSICPRYGPVHVSSLKDGKLHFIARSISTLSASLVVYKEDEVVVVSAWEDNSEVDVKLSFFCHVRISKKKKLICCPIPKLNKLFQKYITQCQGDNMGVHNCIKFMCSLKFAHNHSPLAANIIYNMIYCPKTWLKLINGKWKIKV